MSRPRAQATAETVHRASYPADGGPGTFSARLVGVADEDGVLTVGIAEMARAAR